MELLDLPNHIQILIYSKCDIDSKVNLIKIGLNPELIIGKLTMPKDTFIEKIIKFTNSKDRCKILFTNTELYNYVTIPNYVIDFSQLFPNIS